MSSASSGLSKSHGRTRILLTLIGALYPELRDDELPGGLNGVLKRSSRYLRIPRSAELLISVRLVRGGVVRFRSRLGPLFVVDSIMGKIEGQMDSLSLIRRRGHLGRRL